jgi:hypothetical protein
MDAAPCFTTAQEGRKDAGTAAAVATVDQRSWREAPWGGHGARSSLVHHTKGLMRSRSRITETMPTQWMR